MLTLVAALALSHAPFGTRTEQDGWIYLHIGGNPHEVGYEQGILASKEIDDDIEACAAVTKQNTGKTWSELKGITHKLFWSGLDQEVRDELQGIADGVTEKGKIHDIDDLLTLNAYIEICDYYLPWATAGGVTALAPFSTRLSCSAFVATGKATKDGKPVMGHNFWWDPIMGSRWNMILDVTPTGGHRFILDGPPGFIHSGSDFAVNDAGMMLCETTISGFRGFDPKGIPEFVRMRKAIQYGDSLQSMVGIFEKGNNGGYANTWLMADCKTNEIGKLELGLKNMVYSHESDGYYVGSNFAEDPKLTKEETNYVATPDNNCEVRKQTWYTLLDGAKGKVDYLLAEQFLGDGKLCAGALNAKVATADSLKTMSIWARMGRTGGEDYPIDTFFNAGSPLKPFAHKLKGQKWSVFPPK